MGKGVRVSNGRMSSVGGDDKRKERRECLMGGLKNLIIV